MAQPQRTAVNSRDAVINSSTNATPYTNVLCAPRAVREYLDTLDEAAFGAASEVQPKFTSHSDLADQWTAARKGPVYFSYSDNYLIDTDHGVIIPSRQIAAQSAAGQWMSKPRDQSGKPSPGRPRQC